MIQNSSNYKFILCFLLLIAGIPSSIKAQEGRKFSVQIENYTNAQIYLYQYYGATPTKIDSATIGEDQKFVFEGKEKLRKGMYLFLLPPNNKAIQFFLTPEDQTFEVNADFDNLNASHIQFHGTTENELFYIYLRVISGHNVYAQQFNQSYASAETEEDKLLYRQKLDSLSHEVKTFQRIFSEEHPNTMVSLLAGLDRITPVPEFEGTEEEVRLKRYHFTRDHYFDHIDISDSSLLMLPLFVRKVDTYLNRLIPQEGDSITMAVDKLMSKIPLDSENYKYFLRYFFRTYEFPRYIGLDGVYVHLADHYVKEGMASWLSEEERNKILKRAEQFRIILVGAQAPAIKMFKRDGSEFNLYDLDAEFTILFFWRPGCGHCKKARPHIKAFYEKYKSKGIEVVGLCTALRSKTPECWTYVDEHQINDWIHVVDAQNQSRFVQKYNAGRTPKIYVLDKNKKILIKGFDAERLEEVMDKLLTEQAQSNK